jgi:hypothetical protein
MVSSGSWALAYPKIFPEMLIEIKDVAPPLSAA